MEEAVEKKGMTGAKTEENICIMEHTHSRPDVKNIVLFFPVSLSFCLFLSLSFSLSGSIFLHIVKGYNKYPYVW